MIWIDWVLLLLLAVSTVIGLWRGLVREVLSILIWVVAVWAALKFSGAAAEMLSGWITVPSLQALVGFLGVLTITLIIGGLLVWLIGKLVDSTGLSGTDRMFGMLFGIGRGVIIIAMAVLVARFTPIPEDSWWQESLMLPYFERLAEHGVTFLPEDIGAILHSEPKTESDAGMQQTTITSLLSNSNAAATNTSVDQSATATPVQPDDANADTNVDQAGGGR